MSDLPNFPVEGGCICGAVRYQLSGPPLGIYNCHCADCRRTAGSPYSSSMMVRSENFTLLAGETMVYDKLAASGRVVRQHSCRVCATRIFHHAVGNSEFVTVKPGTLDDCGWVEPVGNIWTDSRAPWVEIDWSMPHFPGQPASREPLFAAWQQRFGTSS